jgi:Cytochrome c7 and related cytochrome c
MPNMAARAPLAHVDCPEPREGRRAPSPAARRWTRAALTWCVLGAASAHAAEPATPAPAAPVELSESPQPGEVPMDHKLHAGQYQIPCLACHLYADRGPTAGIPSASKCMGCHKLVGKDKRGVQILAKRFAQGQALRWTRVYAVPDFIYFSHRPHILKGVECKECHGDVAASQTVESYQQPFTMGRCLECHQSRMATQDCLACHK